MLKVPKSIVFVVCIISMLFSAMSQSAERSIGDLSRSWLFTKSDVAGAESPDFQAGADWIPIDLPHTWNLTDTFDDEPGYYRGVGCYRKVLGGLPKNLEDKRVTIRFEAACNVATVWLNGRLLGQHKGAWTPFEFDVSGLIKPEQNMLAVKVDNRWRRDVPPHDMDFNIMGGLHRGVSIIITDRLYIKSTHATTPQVSEKEGTAAFEVEVCNRDDKARSCEVLTEITGPGLDKPITLASPAAELAPGKTILIKQQTQPIAGVKLWSPDEPNLYRVAYRLKSAGEVVDNTESPLGFRWYRFDAAKGFFLNGKHVKLHGVNRHDDYPGLGWAIPKSRQIEDLKLVKQLGANFIRTTHYPQDPIVLETCDRLGIMVWEEVPFDGEGNHRASYVGAEDFARTLKQNLREMIRRDRNHPSIILWSMGNENLNGPDLDDWKAVAKLTRQLVEIAKQEDPTRPTTVAINNIEHAIPCGLTQAVDVLGFNIYANWNYQNINQKIDETRTLVPNKPMIIGEYGLDIERGLHAEKPKHRGFTEEYGCLYHSAYWKAIVDRPYIAGSLVWVMCDFGAEKRVADQTIRHMNQKGIFSFDRQPKDAAWFYRSQWTADPMVYIVSHTWTKREKGAHPIKVYSNCDSVELFLNGKSLGAKNKADALEWQVPLAEGKNELRAEATGAGKKTVDSLVVECE